MSRFFLVLLLCFGINVFAKDASNQKETATALYIHGEITPQLAEVANEIAKFSKNTGQIWFIIDSEGGDVEATIKFIAAMHIAQQKGAVFTCLATGNVMSAAFFIYAECDKRVSLEHTTFLFHRVRRVLTGAFNVKELTKVAVELEKEDGRLINRLLEKLHPQSREWFDASLEKEYYLDADELMLQCPGFFTITNNPPVNLQLFYTTPRYRVTK